jgi:hypothetical protein
MKIRTVILGLLLLLCSVPAFSQACAMCASTARASSEEGRRAITKGVVILLVPPLGIMSLGVWMAFRYGKKRDVEQATLPIMPLR